MERGVFAESSACSATVPCAVPWFEELGYVTLAFMAMSGFLLIGTLLVLDGIWDRRATAAPGPGPDGHHGEPGPDHADDPDHTDHTDDPDPTRPVPTMEHRR